MMPIERACHKDYQCSIINTSEDMSKVKDFVRRMDRQIDEWVLMYPAFAKA